MVDTPYIEDRSTRANTRIVVLLSGLVAGMVGLSFAAVPLYSLFCAVTGYGGTTQRADGNPKGVIARQMTTRFDVTVPGGLPIAVTPSRPVASPIGEVQTITYRARNLSNQVLTTTAGFNVTPELAGAYFNKIECFCFTEQTLQPGETVDMPVSFFVDPDLDANSDLDTIREITLSYTFYAAD
ncbi:MAG: cytochrome c oxidase assembly protein [Alphaproteobacteria bacterium]|nr:cytochrome c oxidase assembly protein [Alphaproteobacteria bacterium]